MVTKRKLLLYGTFFCVFFWDILDLIFPKVELLFLLILFTISMLKSKKILISKKTAIFFVVLLFHGLFNVVIGNDSIDLLMVQLSSIIFCYVAFANVISQYDVNDIVSVYWKFATVTALIGVVEQLGALLNLRILVKIPFLYTFTKFDYRVIGFAKISSICREPSFLGYILAPAVCLTICYYYAPEFIDVGLDLFQKKYQRVLIILAYLFTFSGVAYFGVAIMLGIIWYKKRFSVKKLILPILAAALFMMAYFNVPDVHIRIDDTLRIFLEGDMDGSIVNLSSYTYYSNYLVVKKTLAKTIGLGSGLGSYQMMFDKFNNSSWGGSGISLNREDANSGLFRIAAEMGIPGVMGVVFFLAHYFPPKSKKRVAYSIALSSLLMMFLLRQGNYIHAGSVLFIMLYQKNHFEPTKLEKKEKVTYERV